jgi:cardiolipin synthase
MSAGKKSARQWLNTGNEVFPAMLEAIDAARDSIRLETYIYTDGLLGRQFLAALVAAQRRGVRVRVLLDALGSWLMPDDFFAELFGLGGRVQYFNPLRLWRFGVRNHRKLLVCDDRAAFVGGFNISDEYNGDGITRGWRDLGMRVEDPALVAGLAASFDELFALADFHRKPLLRLRAFAPRRKTASGPEGQLLLNQPGLGPSPLQHALRHDLHKARDVRLVTAYFLPPWKIRRDLAHAARRGARVQLILAGQSDVMVAQMAGRHLYRQMLRAGVEIHEYQPQILHAKLFVIDQAVYLGSANLDIRSLKLNYELMLRFEDETLAAEARAMVAALSGLSRRIERAAWRRSRTLWQRLESAWAYFLLARVDRHWALRQFRAVKPSAAFPAGRSDRL